MGDKLENFKARVDQFKKNRSERKERERLDADETNTERLAREEQERRAKGGKKRIIKDILGGAATGGIIGALGNEEGGSFSGGAAFGATLGAAKSLYRTSKHKIQGKMSGMGDKSDAELAELRAQKLRSVADRIQAKKGN